VRILEPHFPCCGRHRQSIASAASGKLIFSKVRSDIFDFYACYVLSFEKWSAQPPFDAEDPKVVVDFYVPS
jgi:hypothetical protein